MKNVFRSYCSKDSYDTNNIANSELVYEFAGGGSNNSYNLLFFLIMILKFINAKFIYFLRLIKINISIYVCLI